MPNILIADGHSFVRAGFKNFLECEFGAFIGNASSSREVLTKLKRHAWDLLLLDIRLPHGSEPDVLSKVHSHSPATRILTMGGARDERYAQALLRAGAHGHVSKTSTLAELACAVRLVLEGHTYINARLIGDPELRATESPFHTTLSTREYEVFEMLALNLGVGRIAADLALTVRTVRAYRTRLLQKLRVRSDTDSTWPS